MSNYGNNKNWSGKIFAFLFSILTAVMGFFADKAITYNQINSSMSPSWDNNIAQSGIVNSINYLFSGEEPITPLINAYLEISKENTELTQKLAAYENNQAYSQPTMSTNFQNKQQPPDESADWMDQCSPFNLGGTGGGSSRKMYMNTGARFQAGGKEFLKGFTLYSYGDNFASFNLDEKYSSVKFYVGFVEGTIYDNMLEMTISINGEYFDTYSIDMTDAAGLIEIPLNYARSMKIEIKGQCGTVGFGGGHFFD